MSHVTALVAKLRAAAGEQWVYTQEHQLRTYESDGLLQYSALPAVAVLPGSAEQVQACVKACAEEDVPWVARGSGSGLSGGTGYGTDAEQVAGFDWPGLQIVDADGEPRAPRGSRSPSGTRRARSCSSAAS